MQILINHIVQFVVFVGFVKFVVLVVFIIIKIMFANNMKIINKKSNIFNFKLDHIISLTFFSPNFISL